MQAFVEKNKGGGKEATVARAARLRAGPLNVINDISFHCIQELFVMDGEAALFAPPPDGFRLYTP